MSEWKPIDSAPKGSVDRPIPIVVIDARSNHCGVASWCDEDEHVDRGWIDMYDEGISYDPTHWMPLPGPPK